MQIRVDSNLPCRDRGAALLASLLATLMIAAIGLGLVTVSTTERAVVAYARESLDGLYAAEAVTGHAIDELRAMPDWQPVVAGLTRSSFADASTIVTTSFGALDLGESTASLQARSDAELRLGANNPVWRLYANGPVDALFAASIVESPTYVVAWVADDPADDDGEPSADANDVIVVRGRAVGRGGLMREVQVSLKRTDPYSSGPEGRPRSAPGRGPSTGAALARILPDPAVVVGSRQITNPGVQVLTWREVR